MWPDFVVVLQLATEPNFLFDKVDPDEKRLLCETVLKHVHIKEGKEQSRYGMPPQRIPLPMLELKIV